MTPANENPAAPRRRSRAGTWIVATVIVAAAAAGGWYWLKEAGTGETARAAAPGNASGGGGGSRKGGPDAANRGPLPVATAAVRAADFNVYLNALGTVTPRNTVDGAVRASTAS